MPSLSDEEEQKYSGNTVELQIMLPSPNHEHGQLTPSGEDQPSPKMKNILSPLLKAMTVFGLYHESPPGCRISVSLVYCVIIVFLACSNFFRMFFIYRHEAFSTLMIKVMFHIFFFEIALTLLLFLLKICKHLPSLFAKWDQYREEYESVSSSHLRKFVLKAATGFIVVYFLLMCSFIYGQVHKQEQLIRYLLAPQYNDHELPMHVKYIYAVCHSFFSFVFMLSVFFIFVMSKLLGKEFLFLKSQFQEYVRNLHDNDDPETFEQFRFRHLYLSKLVKRFDEAVSGLILTAGIIDVPIVAIHVFFVMTTDEKLDLGWKQNLFIQLLSSTVGITHVMFATVSGAIISGKVSAWQHLII